MINFATDRLKAKGKRMSNSKEKDRNTITEEPKSGDEEATWLDNIIAVIVAVLCYTFMEWLFIVTKPSFLSLENWPGKVLTLVISTIFISAGMAIVASIVFLLTKIIADRRIRFFVRNLFPAFILASLSLLLFDNFTYTLFGFGISTSQTISRILYLLGFICLILLWRVEISRVSGIIKKTTSKLKPAHRKVLLVGLPILFFLLTFPFVKFSDISMPSDSSEGNYPNIIIFTADGLNADHLSLYGYERDTTPFLRSIVESTFFSTNHFSNSGSTSGGVTSVLTGKYPTTTRVLYPPDTLRGVDTRQHLPGILKLRGYYNAQFSVEHFVDVKRLNFTNGFDEVDGEKLNEFSLPNLLNDYLPINSRLFLQEIVSRLTDRLKHIFFIRVMGNPYLEITTNREKFDDLDKMNRTVSLIAEKDEPVFIHVHWMGTHGAKFYPDHITFSSGIDRNNQNPWDQDLYDDSILDMDTGLETLITGLDEIGELGKTIVVITSDHGQQWSTLRRIPLIFIAQSGLPKTNLISNTQSIDVAPTILDYMGIPVPEWMSGESLLDNSYVSQPVIGGGTVYSFEDSEKGWLLDPNYIQPPFYQFDYVTLVDCNDGYKLNLNEFTWTHSKIQNYFSSCDSHLSLTPTDVRNLIITRLTTDGFEVPSESSPIPDL